MAKKTVEEQMDNNFTIDSAEVKDFSKQQETIDRPAQPELSTRGRVSVASRNRDTDNLINCLENRIVTVKFIPNSGKFTDPKHVLYGGMAEMSTFTVTVPKLRSGTFKNVLTDDEKDYPSTDTPTNTKDTDKYTKIPKQKNKS